MRRKKDDKRVLRSGNGRQNTSKIKLRRGNKNKLKNRPVMHRDPTTGRARKKRKASKTVLAIMIVALIAFVIGAGIGVSLSFDDGSDDEGPKYENVTEEMTTNLNDTEEIYYDHEADALDYNENVTSQLNVDTPNNDASET